MRLPHKLVRGLHLAAAPLIGAFVYSRALRDDEIFAAVVQWAAFPLLAAAGLALWLGPRLARSSRGPRA
jgi:hypothetical protein